MNNKLVSIIIPTLNEKTLIEQTLISLKKQTYKPIEIIVVDNGSIDRTSEIAKKYTNKVLYLAKRGASRARNFGTKSAQGKYLLFLDADTKLSKNAVKNAVKSIEEGWAGGVFRVKYDKKSTKIKLIEKIQNFYLGRGKPFYIQSIFTTKEIFEKSKGWNEKIRFGEDIDMLKKISRYGKLKFISSSFIETSPRRFIKNKDYFYAITGGALALYGVKSLPFYPIRDIEKNKRAKKTSFRSSLKITKYLKNIATVRKKIKV